MHKTCYNVRGMARPRIARVVIAVNAALREKSHMILVAQRGHTIGS